MRGRWRDARLRWSVRAAVAAVLMLGIPVGAAAHPFVAGGGTVAVASLAPITLDLAHGCGDERSGAGLVTDEVALEVPAWLRIVEVADTAGWRSVVESAAGTAAGAVVWTATAGGETAPRFALLVVVDGEAGVTRYLRVSQRCGDVVERWIGTPEEPAERPAVRLRLVAADPASPPPPPAPGPAPVPVEAETPPAPVPTPESATAPVEAPVEAPVGTSVEEPTVRVTLVLAAALVSAALLATGVLVRARQRRHAERATTD